MIPDPQACLALGRTIAWFLAVSAFGTALADYIGASQFGETDETAARALVISIAALILYYATI